jgi:hypothetical protein
MRTTFNIEDGLLEVAKQHARKSKNSLSAVINEALRMGLLRAETSRANESNTPLKTFRGDGFQAGVDLSNSRDLLDLMEQP